MQRTIAVLGGLLAVQLVLAGVMRLTGPSLTAQRPDIPLLALDGQGIDRVTIEGPDDQRVVLVRDGGEWKLPETDDFPADRTKVDGLLERLKGLERGPAVATTDGARTRFKVSDDAFERRVVLARGDEKLATLYLGTSPGVHQVHARTGADQAVYATKFGIYDVPVKADDWEDKGVLEIPPDQIASIDVGGLELTRSPAATATKENDRTGDNAAAAKPAGKPTWSGDGLADGETLSQASADALAQKLSTLTFGSVLGREAKPEYGLEAPALVFDVRREDGETLEYRLGKRKDDYVLKVSDRPEYFRLPSYTADALIKAAGHDQLVMSATAATHGGKAAPHPPEPAPAGGAAAPGRPAAEEGAS